jgi:hypothetical protein
VTLHKTRLGTNEDGSPQWHYHEDDPSKGLVYVGPNINGTVQVEGLGTVDVNELIVSVPKGSELALSDAVGQKFVDEGHPSHDGDVPFEFVPSSESHPDGLSADPASQEIAPAAQRALDGQGGSATTTVPDQVVASSAPAAPNTTPEA